jgi:citrate lyase beta subunit
MRLTLSPADLAVVIPELSRANEEFGRAFPGEPGSRRPVHTVYGGAHLFRSDTAATLGRAALRSLDEYAPDPETFASALGVPEAVYTRVREKLEREPVEDYRIDFEDGYGYRRDSEEDGHALSAAGEAALAFRGNTLPPFFGFRIKSFSPELYRRSIRTLDLFLTTLLEKTGGDLPPNFVVCLPKITVPEQVQALADILDRFAAPVKIEIMVETTQCIPILPQIAAAARGKCIAAHLGAFDFTSGQNVAVSAQSYGHPANDFARQMMQIAFAGTGIRIVDSVTNVIPKGDRDAVHRAWRIHAEHVRHSLVRGIYQGWDLHPAQIPARYAAVYAFFLENLAPVSERLRAFVDRATQATMAGNVFDDAATGQGMLNFFLQAVNCGALHESEIPAQTGLSVDELRSGSFAAIVASRAP